MKINFLLFLILLIHFFNDPLNSQTHGWGRNDSGMLGIGNANNPQPNPVTLGTSSDDVTGISGGRFHTLFLKANGSVQSTGSNNFGQLGDGTLNTSTTPGEVNGLSNVVAISAGLRHSLALLSNGTVMAWGSTAQGQLGGGGDNCGPQNCPTPGAIPELSNVIAIEAGLEHSLALKSDGTVWAWGRNGNGQIGNGTEGNCLCDTIFQVGIGVPEFNNIISIKAGESHSIALKSNGTVWVWGNNTFGTVGNGASGGNQLLPVQNVNITGVSQIAAGFNFNVALKPDGTVFAWGFNTRGNMGNGTSGGGVATPVQSTITNVIDIKTTGVHTLAKKSDGSIWAWGWNQHGEIGIGVADTGLGCQCRSTPVQSNVGTGNPVFGVGENFSFVAKPLITLNPGSNITIFGENFTLNFSNISSVTTINILAIDPSSTGLTVPMGYAILTNSPAYNITATPAVTGTIIPCIKVSNVFSQSQFANLRLLHGEGGELVDRTVLPNNYQLRQIDGQVTSLSPFVIAEDLAPTAASVSVGGRVLTAAGQGVSRAFVTLTDATGMTQTGVTNTFGYYRFKDVAAGETYVVSASHRRYRFDPQIVNVADSVSDLNFTANAWQ